jgi:ABC-2 type transport system permease protein
MHNTGRVFRFELQSILHKKSVRVVTIIMSLLLFAATCIPTVMTLFKSTTPVNPNPAIIDIGNAGILLTTDVFTQTELKVYVGDKVVFYTAEAALREDVQNGKRSTGFVIDSLTSFTSIVKNKEMYSSSTEMMKYLIQTINTNRNLLAAGIDPLKVKEASNVILTTHEIVLGKDANNSFLISYLLMFAVYMLVIQYGSFVSTSVAREKDNRTMEILITSTKPDALIVGKVLANGVAGLLQFFIVFASALIGYFVNQSNFPAIVRTMLFGSLSWDAIVVFLIFTALGYLLYLFIYASLGSLVSKVEDVGASVSLVTVLFVIAYMIASIGMNMPNSLVIKIGSYVPFTAILSMPIRYFLTAVPIYELVISLTLMALTTWLFAIISIRIYRLGSLSYGNKMSLIKALKAIFAKV